MSGHSNRPEEEELIQLFSAISACRCWGCAAPRWTKDITRSKAAEAKEVLRNVQLSGNLHKPEPPFMSFVSQRYGCVGVKNGFAEMAFPAGEANGATQSRAIRLKLSPRLAGFF
jgi:hypothetical protein